MKKTIMVTLLIIIICLGLGIWDYYRYDQLWHKSYIGLQQADVKRILGQHDTGDFDGSYWCNGIKMNGCTFSTKALFLAVDSSLVVV